MLLVTTRNEMDALRSLSVSLGLQQELVASHVIVSTTEMQSSKTN